MARKKTFPVGYGPEDLPTLQWLDKKEAAAVQKARESGQPIRGVVDRSVIIMDILRRAMQAEQAAEVPPGVALPSAPVKTQTKTRHNPPKATPRPAKRSSRTR